MDKYFYLQDKEFFKRLEEAEENGRVAIELNGSGGSYVGISEYVICEDVIEKKKIKELVQIIAIKPKTGFSSFEKSVARKSRVPKDTQLILVRKLEMKDKISHPPLVLRSYKNVPFDCQEAILTCLATLITPNQITDIGHVHHIEDINNLKYSCGGMKNVFGLRRMRIGSSKKGKLARASPSNHKSYRNPFSFSKRQWDFNNSASKLLCREMSKVGNKKGRVRTIKIHGINKETFNHFKSGIVKGCGEDDLILQSTKADKGESRAQKMMLSDLSSENVTVRVQREMVRGLTEPSVKAFKGRFGTTFGVGNPTAVPTQKQIKNGTKPDAPLDAEHKLCIVTTKEEDEDMVEELDAVPFLAQSEFVNDIAPHN